MLETICKYYKDEAMFHGFIPHIMGTRFDILLIHSDTECLNELWTHIVNELERLDKILNRFDPHSEVSGINKRSSQSYIQISEELEAVFQLCQYYYENTFHLFDITLKDFSKVQMHDNQRISFMSPDISLNFGGFAKGYALKKIKRFIEQKNVNHAFVNFGNSSILGMGHHPYGDSWKVSFLNPYNQSLLNEFNLENTALSTSGNTIQYTRHIMNPITGIFNEQRKASSIISTDPLEAEVLSTIWMIANKEQQLLLTKNFQNIQATIYDL